LFVRFKQKVSSRGAVTDGWLFLYVRALAIVVILLICGATSFAYSVLPGLSEDQIRQAHAYAYGGAVIQDLGST
jgi:hypothetical protein